MWNYNTSFELSSVPLKTQWSSLAFSIDFRITIDASKIIFMLSCRSGLFAATPTAAFWVALGCTSVGLFDNGVNFAKLMVSSIFCHSHFLSV